MQKERCSWVFQRSINTPEMTQTPSGFFPPSLQSPSVEYLHLHTNRHYKSCQEPQNQDLERVGQQFYGLGELHFKRWNKDITLENLQSIWSGLALPCLQVCLLFCCTNLQQKQMSVCRAVFLCWQEPEMFKQLPQSLVLHGACEQVNPHLITLSQVHSLTEWSVRIIIQKTPNKLFRGRTT